VLDLKVIREQPEAVERALAQKGGAELVTQIVALDGDRRRLIKDTEDLKAQRNRASEAIGQAKRKGEDASAEMARVREVGDRIKGLDAALKAVDERVEALLAQVPNLPHPSVPPGTSDADNVEVRTWGAPRAFSFTPRPHEEVGEALGLLDTERAVKLAKSRFTVLWGGAARLSRALAQFMLDLHTREHGYTELWVPHMVSADTMLRTGQLPKFEEDLFAVPRAEAEKLYLIPTAEVPVTNMVRDEIVPLKQLPLKFVCHSPCFRSEAGSYGKDTRGMIRQHQFDKVELVQIVHPDRSYEALEELTGHAEQVLRRLELPFRTVVLCTGDMGFSSAKTYDIEVWLPGQKAYREISSCSNFESFQARRMQARFRNEKGKPELVHTLNGSGLAVGRTLVAVMENYQNADGTITVPEVLRPYMGGRNLISAQ